MFQFIRSQPRVIERIVAHIETPSFVDLLVRIIQLDEHPSGGDVLEVCCSMAAVLASTEYVCSGYPQKT